MDKWVAGLFILVLLLFFGFSILDTQVNSSGSTTPEIASNCPVNQFATAENATGGLNCATALTTQTAVSTEASATCPIGKDAQNESANGSFMCGYPTSLHGTFPWGNLTSFPASCNANHTGWVVTVGTTLVCSNVPFGQANCTLSPCNLNIVGSSLIDNNVKITGTSAITVDLIPLLNTGTNQKLQFDLIGNNSTQTSPICPASGDFEFVNGIEYSNTSCYSLLSKNALLIWNDKVSWFGIASTKWSELTGFPASCSSGQFVNTNGVTNTCSGILNDMANNTKSCADVTSGTVHQMGFKLNFTTTYTTNVSVTVNFQITTPATITLNTKYRLSYGTGSAPACNAAQTGTGIGNQYELLSFGGTAATTWSQIEQFSLTAVIQNPTANTAYWVDIQALDSSSATWTYAIPTMTVVQG